MAHAHDHAHDRARQSRRRLAVVLGITCAVLVASIIGAAITGSLALLADAGHMLTDAVGLAVALLAGHLITRPASDRRTWGLQRAEVLAAAAQGMLLLLVGGYVVVEAIHRLMEPPQVAAGGMLAFGLFGLLGNLVALAVLARNRSADLNLRAAFLEVLNDALGSLAVIVAAIAIALTGWTRADAVASLVIGILIVPRTVILLRDAGRVLLESTPAGLDLNAVRQHILEVPHVRDVHDLHASLIATGLPVLTAHVVVDDKCFYDGHTATLLADLQRCVAGHFPVSVEHSTFQFEPTGHTDHEPHGHR